MLKIINSRNTRMITGAMAIYPGSVSASNVPSPKMETELGFRVQALNDSRQSTKTYSGSFKHCGRGTLPLYPTLNTDTGCDGQKRFSADQSGICGLLRELIAQSCGREIHIIATISWLTKRRAAQGFDAPKQAKERTVITSASKSLLRAMDNSFEISRLFFLKLLPEAPALRK
jgi:hypothetical protein